MFFFSPRLDPFADDLAAIHPALQLKISTRAKRMALRLDPQGGRINLVVPRRASLKKALEFARTYREWIDRHAANLPDAVAFTDGTTLPLFGRDRTIRVHHDENRKTTTFHLHDDELIVLTNKEDPSQRIIRHLKKLAKDRIAELAREKAARIGKPVRSITIRDTTSRWGSCSPDGALSFSWRLIFAPEESLDYVVAHEVAHLMHMNHKARFWALCEKLSGDFAGGRGWMQRHAQELMRYKA